MLDWLTGSLIAPVLALVLGTVWLIALLLLPGGRSFLKKQLGKSNPNGSGIWRCSCCGCWDGCDKHCDAKRRECRIHGVRLPAAKTLRGG